MNFIYFAHSYRDEDAGFVEFFGRLMRSEDLIPSLDPPSKSVNAAKLERHLASSDGMVALLSWREDGVSQHILFEIALAVKARKPLLVFVEDVLPDLLVPPRVLQRRFSRRRFLRQTREHRHAIQILKTYMGEAPTPRYQPSLSRRTCLTIGYEVLSKDVVADMRAFVDRRGYEPLTFEDTSSSNIQNASVFEAISSADVALCFVDTDRPESNYLLGSVYGAFVPSIAFTMDDGYSFDPATPREYQPQLIRDLNTFSTFEETLTNQFELFEEDFLELENQDEVERYASLLVDLQSDRERYGDRNVFIEEMIMRDKYEVSGQAGAVGPGAHAENMTFVQSWRNIESEVDLGTLAAELSQLRAALRERAAEPEHDIAVAEVASAEVAAKQGDGPEVMSHLAKVGQWGLETATTIGTGVAAAALKGALGL